ncbi:MAG: Quinohemoprotein alcohol dehydrogenase QdgA, partial [Nevskia sp.]|nr:Quinohemoprotein alcohol dehydrogenase QdgA [Nevskia sp.]
MFKHACAGVLGFAVAASALAAGGAAQVDGARIIKADGEPGNWLTTARTYNEQRFSPLKDIDAGNVSKLGLAWTYRLDVDRVVEATPVVVDGTMYTTGAFSMVYALDAASGALKWKFDPQVPRDIDRDGCCDVANRGVAVWKGRVYVASYDGRLFALDAASGRKVWMRDTVIDHKRSYTVTGAPRIIKGQVIIGNGGAEFGVRGY